LLGSLRTCTDLRFEWLSYFGKQPHPVQLHCLNRFGNSASLLLSVCAIPCSREYRSSWIHVRTLSSETIFLYEVYYSLFPSFLGNGEVFFYFFFHHPQALPLLVFLFFYNGILSSRTLPIAFSKFQKIAWEHNPYLQICTREPDSSRAINGFILARISYPSYYLLVSFTSN